MSHPVFTCISPIADEAQASVPPPASAWPHLHPRFTLFCLPFSAPLVTHLE